MDPPLPLPPVFASPDSEPPPADFELEGGRQHAPGRPEFRGLRVIPDFLDPGEADALLDEIEREPFVPAQSGKWKQHHGARVNFNKRRVNVSRFRGLPRWAAALETRLLSRFAELAGEGSEDAMEVRAALDAFEASDVFVLRYHERDRSNLDFHVDDTFAYGEAIFDVSLESDSAISFYREEPCERGAPRPLAVRARLPARSAALLFGAARYDWQHAILAPDVHGRRTSITLRTLAPGLRQTEDGRRVLEIARGGRS